MLRSLGFSPQNGEGQYRNNFLPSQTITTSVTLQLPSHPSPGDFEMWHLSLPHSRPGGVVLPLLSCTLGSQGSVAGWQLLARGGLPVPVLGLLEFAGHGPSLAPVSHKAQTRLLLLVENVVTEYRVDLSIPMTMNLWSFSVWLNCFQITGVLWKT